MTNDCTTEYAKCTLNMNGVNREPKKKTVNGDNRNIALFRDIVVFNYILSYKIRDDNVII